MIDIHSHILPGVDDGARTLAEAFTMLEMAIDQGVTTQVLTPHIHIGRYNNTKLGLQEEFDVFEARVQDKGLDIELKLAAEVRIGIEVMQLIARNQIPWLGELNGKIVFLLEFPRTDIPYGSDNLVQWCIQNNVLPLIVHPERNKSFVDHPEKLQPFIDMGCPLQITASSLMGKFGDDVKQMALNLIMDGHVFAIASDCHNLKGRAPDLGSTIDALSKHSFSEASLDVLVRGNPMELLKLELEALGLR